MQRRPLNETRTGTHPTRPTCLTCQVRKSIKFLLASDETDGLYIQV